MKKLTFERLTFELTQRCNMKCAHCCRGESRDVDLRKEDVDALLNQTQMIYHVDLYGGEPLLNLDIMRYIVDGLFKRKIPVLEFGITTNGLIYSEEVIETIKRYAELVKISRECFFPNEKKVLSQSVVLGISIDPYHTNQDEVLRNKQAYKEKLNGRASVISLSGGAIPNNTGRGRHLKQTVPNRDLQYAINRRIEILDDEHKPICPYFMTYKLLFEGQTIICCNVLLSANGKLYPAEFAYNEYEFLDSNLCICKASNDIYQSIIEYNKYREDCLQVMKERAKNISDKSQFELMWEHRYLYLHMFGDAYKYVKNTDDEMCSLGLINDEKESVDINMLMKAAIEQPEIIDKIRNAAAKRNYDIS